jgi:type 1 glutamine amidotransferase
MSYVRNILLSVLLASVLVSCNWIKETPEITCVLILSGQNNHEWQKTSPLIAEILEKSGLFEVAITNDPDTLTYKSLKRYQVLLSNRNTWPDTSARMSRRWENDFVKFVSKGGGFVSLHAGSSAFYGWNDFHRIGIGRWGRDTRHGRITTGRLCELDQDHPVTKGLKEFYITDEFWEKTDIYPGSIPIARVCAESGSDGKPIIEPVLLYNNFRKGRCIYIALGHDEKAIKNTGLRTLLIRSTQWAARKRIDDETIPCFLREESTLKEAYFTWSETDTSVCLKNSSNPVWQFNFNDRYGKPYFHPVTAGKSILTGNCWRRNNGSKQRHPKIYSIIFNV